MNYYNKVIWFSIGILSLFLTVGITLSAKEEEQDTDITWEQNLQLLPVDEINDVLKQIPDTEKVSFSVLIRSLLKGELPISFEQIKELAYKSLLDELTSRKSEILQILIIVIASSLSRNFIQVFKSAQIAEISFYINYLLITVTLVRIYLSMREIAEQTCRGILSFVKVLLPTYLMTVVFSSGTITALGFYELTVLALQLMQGILLTILVPAVGIYFVLNIMNQLTTETILSRLILLLETSISWCIRMIPRILLGLQAVQCLVTPAVDHFKTTGLHQIVKALPGIGNAFDSAAETLAGSAIILKNAVGVAGICVLGLIGLMPLLRLGAMVFLFQFLCAIIQPISEKRIAVGIESIAHSGNLLFRITAASLGLFLVSLAMVTASIHV